MIRLLLVRHGETAWNATGRYQGQKDIPLSDVGRRQAETVARRLSSATLHAVYTSDLSRARETAEILARPHGLTVRPDARLRELNFGEWQGLTYREIAQQDGERLAIWNADRVHRTPPGGESLAEMGQRSQSLLDEIRAVHQGKTVVLVSHGGAIRTLLCVLVGHPLGAYWQFEVDNTAISEIELQDRGPVVIRWNDVHHLDEARRLSVF